jgi:hypothetical protein
MGLLSAIFPTKSDTRLGDLHYAFGKWTSTNARLFGRPMLPLRIPGDRSGPSQTAQEALERAEAVYASLQPQIAEKLFELYQNIAQSAPSSQLSEELGYPFPKLLSADEVWNHVRLKRVWVGAYGAPNDVELAYSASWELEHTAGALIRDGQLVEFCASVGPW